MTRVFLAAGVAALAIAAPASAGPGGGHGKDRQAQVERQGGGERAAAIRSGITAQRAERRAFAAPRIERQQRFAAIERPQRVERMQMRAERPQMRMQRVEQAQSRIAERQQMRVNRQQVQNRLAERQQMRVQRQQVQNMRAQRMEQGQARMAQQQQLRANRQQQIQTRIAQQQTRANTRQQVQAQMALRQQLQASRALSANVNNRFAVNNAVSLAQRQQQVVALRNVRAMLRIVDSSITGQLISFLPVLTSALPIALPR